MRAKNFNDREWSNYENELTFKNLTVKCGKHGERKCDDLYLGSFAFLQYDMYDIFAEVTYASNLTNVGNISFKLSYINEKFTLY